MRRLFLAAALVAAVAAAVGLTWRWWTAPPSASRAALVAALAAAPAEAEGSLALAQPDRAARWLASHPQALALVELAAPSISHSLPRLRRLLAALAREARGPLTVWWRGDEAGAGATVQRGAAQALQQLAALEGFALHVDPEDRGAVAVRVATAPALLAPPGGAPSVTGGPASASAVALLGRRLWWVAGGRSSLQATWGAPPTLAEANGGDTVATADLARLLAPVSTASWIPHSAAWASVDPGGWAVALPETSLPRGILQLLSGPADLRGGSPDAPYHCRGPLGEFWVRDGHGLVIASREELLADAPEGGIAGEDGTVHGARAARLFQGLAAKVADLPGEAGLAASLRRTVPLLEGVKLARWRVLPEGGRIRLEW